MTRNRAILMLLAASLAFAACDRTSQVAATAPSEAPDPTGGLAPPLVTPGENTPSMQAPSYEVSIAAAAADHNHALARCAQQPEAVRTRCEQEANAAFADVQMTLEPLRGNQE